MSTGGRGAQGDLTGVGGPGGFATNVGFSTAPLSTRPLPEPLGMPPSLTVEDADVVGAGDLGFGDSVEIESTIGGVADFKKDDDTSSACGSVIFVPSVHSIDSGAQSSSSSSISAQFACLFGSSD